eukprot:21281-Rhodomonas_salina.1
MPLGPPSMLAVQHWHTPAQHAAGPPPFRLARPTLSPASNQLSVSDLPHTHAHTPHVHVCCAPIMILSMHVQISAVL